MWISDSPAYGLPAEALLTKLLDVPPCTRQLCREMMNWKAVREKQRALDKKASKVPCFYEIVSRHGTLPSHP